MMPRNRASILTVAARLFAAALLAAVGNGCAAMTNPTLDAVPVRRLPDDRRRALLLRIVEEMTPSEIAVEVNRRLTDYLEGVTGQRVETSSELRGFSIAS